MSPIRELGHRVHFLDGVYDDTLAAIEARDVETAHGLVRLHACHLRDRFVQCMEARYQTECRLDLGSGAPEGQREDEG